MSGISQTLGGSKGTLWKHFSSKEELFSAFLDTTTSAFRQQLITTLVPSRSIRLAVQMFVRRFIERISLPETIKMYRLVIGESGQSPEVGRMFYERAPGELAMILARFLDNHMQTGHLQAADPIRAARTLIALCMGYGHQQILFGGPPPAPNAILREAKLIADDFFYLYAPKSIST